MGAGEADQAFDDAGFGGQGTTFLEALEGTWFESVMTGVFS